MSILVFLPVQIFLDFCSYGFCYSNFQFSFFCEVELIVPYRTSIGCLVSLSFIYISFCGIRRQYGVVGGCNLDINNDELLLFKK